MVFKDLQPFHELAKPAFMTPFSCSYFSATLLGTNFYSRMAMDHCISYRNLGGMIMAAHAPDRVL